jgi:sterol desaturase/sphingolipid hydroxylase (fatty acid hydroxylase superfamily)
MIPTLAALVLALAERIPTLRMRRLPLLRPQLAGDILYLLSGFVVLGALTLAPVRAGSGWVAARLDLGWTAIPWAAQVLVALVLIDLGNYAAHRALHRVDALWRVHAVHHSIVELDWMATFRSHVLEQLLRRVMAPVGLVAVGMPIDATVTASGVFLVWAMTNHANVRLPLAWAEALVVTPRLHRLHHVPATAEHNFGTVFSVWDRLSRRLVVRDVGADTPLGLPRARTTYPQSWLAQLRAPFDRAVRV